MDETSRQRPKGMRMECAFGHLTVGRSTANVHASDDVRQALQAGILRPRRMPCPDDDAHDRAALTMLRQIDSPQPVCRSPVKPTTVVVHRRARTIEMPLPSSGVAAV